MNLLGPNKYVVIANRAIISIENDRLSTTLDYKHSVSERPSKGNKRTYPLWIIYRPVDKRNLFSS